MVYKLYQLHRYYYEIIKEIKKKMKKKFFLFSSIALLTSFVDIQRAKSFDLGAYWLGVGVGIAETLCVASIDGYMTNNSARTILRAYRTNFAKTSEFDSGSFENGVQGALSTYPSCRL